MGSLDRYDCARCGLGFVSGDNSVGFSSQMISVWCAFCDTVHDFSFVWTPGEPKLAVAELFFTPQQQRAVKCLKPAHRPYLLWDAVDGCPACGSELSRVGIMDFD
ncbi:hypothetical protein [Deinococcus sp.]|uniref:hypothetical protein n=1 Tax=Deinococcus sp. TaxID=47478 RepID=UPI0025D1159E|nr:hypothetical protein [Deinococcus sp.]